MIGFAPLATAVILFGLRLLFGSLRVGEEAEMEGLDLSEHSESAYGVAAGAVALETAPHGGPFAMTAVPAREQERLA